jgi:superfamily I DNA/RNA helicase
MAKKPAATKQIETLVHEGASRKNIPTAEFQSVMDKAQQTPLRIAYERRNRDLDPQLVWRGKDEQDWSDLVVPAPPLYIQEKVHPKVLLDDLLRQTKADVKAADAQFDLFSDFNGIPKGADKTEFYAHDQNWSTWQLQCWEDYRDVKRLGRKTLLAEKQRKMLWTIFEKVRGQLADKGLLTLATIFSKTAEQIQSRKHPPFDYAVIDEAQDVGVPELRFLAALGGDRPDSLFFAGDLGQRIFQQPFSWKALGVDVRGRSHTLRINYRTSHQIRRQADRLLPSELADMDGNTESRRGTVSVFNGPEPIISIFTSEQDEAAAVGKWIADLLKDGFQPHEIGVFVRSENQIPRARQAVGLSMAKAVELNDNNDPRSGLVAISPMHLAKGLEFRAVAVMACDDEVIPSQERIESITDAADLEDVYNTERHLLYVACTRARDRLFITGLDPASEFLDDLCMQS